MDAGTLVLPDEKHLKNLRRLTFGGDNAEAYWAPDGRHFVFQRKPPEGGCDQEYLFDLTTGAVTLLSSGNGRTTCGYATWPDGKAHYYATTESGGASCPPSPDYSQGYVWPLYSTYDIVRDDGAGRRTPLIGGPGYDAEATSCFKDGRIVFTSTRDGDIELYTAAADGTGVKRLTNAPGYDGGAFYTQDCSKIVWRASRPAGDALVDYQRLLGQDLVRPSALEIYVMNADGTGAKQLTFNGAANFGPYPTPEMRKVIYSSNVGANAREFDLWMVPMAGGNAERVTFSPGFDGFPMFSPDGRWLIFASNRANAPGGHDTDLYVAEWVP
jgi:Tol biopolymer transport system component